jgi:hypothetical protein
MQEPSSALENTAERRVLRPRGANKSDNANPTDQPSKGIVGSLNWYLSNIFNKEMSLGYFFLQLQSIAFLA